MPKPEGDKRRERYEEIKRRADYNSLRKVARKAKEDVSRGKQYARIKIGEDFNEKITEGVSRANFYIKRGYYWDALKDLNTTYENFQIVSEQLDGKKREKYTNAFLKRLDRIMSNLKPDKSEDRDLITYISQFEKNIEGDIKGHKKSGLEDLSAFIGISSFILSLFFLSSSYTGFVIFDLNNNYSNNLGLILFLVGLIFSFLYFKEIKTRSCNLKYGLKK